MLFIYSYILIILCTQFDEWTTARKVAGEGKREKRARRLQGMLSSANFIDAIHYTLMFILFARSSADKSCELMSD